MKKVKRTEQGYAGHFCVAIYCRFRRNTLLTCGRKRVVVSTVGNYHTTEQGVAQTIGCDRYYETMVFHAYFDKPYFEADVQKQISFESNWRIADCERDSDLRADEMHEGVVAEISRKLIAGLL